MARPAEQSIETNPLWAAYHMLPPEEVCTEVRLEDSGLAIPVEPRVVNIEDEGVTMHEYVTPGGDVRANLLSLEPGVTSPAWHIRPYAGNRQYYERHHTVDGSGELTVWYHLGARHDGGKWETTGRHYMLPDSSPEGIPVIHGDTFQLRAGRVGLHVLALFPGVPFRDEYEERVPSPELLFPAKA